MGITVGKRSCGGYCVSPAPLGGGGTLTEKYTVVFGKDLFGVVRSQLGNLEWKKLLPGLFNYLQTRVQTSEFHLKERF